MEDNWHGPSPCLHLGTENFSKRISFLLNCALKWLAYGKTVQGLSHQCVTTGD